MATYGLHVKFVLVYHRCCVWQSLHNLKHTQSTYSVRYINTIHESSLCIIWLPRHSVYISEVDLLPYCGWKKSCTTLDGWNPITNGINHLSTGAGFLLSTIWLWHFHTNFLRYTLRLVVITSRAILDTLQQKLAKVHMSMFIATCLILFRGLNHPIQFQFIRFPQEQQNWQESPKKIPF